MRQENCLDLSSTQLLSLESTAVLLWRQPFVSNNHRLSLCYLCNRLQLLCLSSSPFLLTYKWVVSSNAQQGAEHQLANSELTRQNAVLQSRNCAERESVSVRTMDWAKEEKQTGDEERFRCRGDAVSTIAQNSAHFSATCPRANIHRHTKIVLLFKIMLGAEFQGSSTNFWKTCSMQKSLSTT